MSESIFINNNHKEIKNIFKENNCDKIQQIIEKDFLDLQIQGESIWPYCSLEVFKMIVNHRDYYKSSLELLEDKHDEWILESVISQGRVDLLEYLRNTYKIKYEDIIKYNTVFRYAEIDNFIHSGMNQYLIDWKNNVK